jgi:cysteine desulfurase family protein (TIGR01976 family)
MSVAERHRPDVVVAPVSDIREQFPALERRHRGHPVAYFDGPGGTQAPRRVGDAMVDYLYHHNANTHWAYPTSAETDAALEQARRVFATFVNAAAPAEIAFGANMTTLTMHLARALGRGWSAGDEIVVTELDHHANVDPWREVARDRGFTVRTARMRTEDAQLEWRHLEQQVGPRTRLLAIGAASNAVGTVNDVTRAVRLARTVGALVFVDGVHSAPHLLPDVRALDCDFFACSAYKFYGPHIGVLYGKHGLFVATDFPRLVPASPEPPERAETGTLNHEGIVGAAAAVEWIASLAPGSDLRGRLRTCYDALHARGEALFQLLWTGLSEIPGVRRFGVPAGAARTPTTAFVVDGVSSADVTRRLADRGVFVSHGDFYAHTVVARLGLHPEGLVRAGCACYTTPDEVGRLLDGVRAIARSV